MDCRKRISPQGLVGSEIASVCRELGLPVTVTERGSGPQQPRHVS
ncbi:MAG: hypothetical protein ACKOQ4_09265 [Mycobacterium sp.]